MSMKVFYESRDVTIYHGDCREIMPALPRVDAIIADPPYGDTSLIWDKQVRGWMDTAESSSSTIWCFGSLRFFMEMARVGECSRWSTAQEIIWEKHNGSGFHADRFKRVHEIIVQFYTGKWGDLYKSPVKEIATTAKRVIRSKRPTHTGDIGKSAYAREIGGEVFMRSVIYARSCHGHALHPTQKPIDILLPLIEYSVPADGTVLDPFCGSGSTLEAALRSGRKSIGIEISEEYCEIAAKRLSGVLQ